MLRHIVAIVAGVSAGWIVVAAIDLIGLWLFPEAGAQSAHAGQLSQMVGELPDYSLWIKQLAWFIGAVSSAWLASRMHAGDRLICGGMAALLLLALSVVSLIVNPSPLWFILLMPIVFLSGATVGLLPSMRTASAG